MISRTDYSTTTMFDKCDSELDCFPFSKNSIMFTSKFLVLIIS